MSHLLLRIAARSLVHGVAAGSHQQNAQMRQLQAQFQYQQQQQSQQAMLADVLFQTEMRARQFHIVAGQDRLVAAVFSQNWLQSVGHVTVEHFPNIDHKRAWAAATSQLRGLMAPIDREPGVAQTVAQFSGATRELEGLGDALGGQPEATVAAQIGQLQVGAEAAEQNARLWRNLTIFAAISVIAAPVGIISLGLILQAADVFDKGPNPLGCIGMLSIFLVIPIALICGTTWSSKSGAAGRQRREIARLGDALTRLNGFLTDPNRGLFLERMHQQHPAFMMPLPNVDAVAAPAQGQLVERQTVVVRCKYCQSLTPVDAHVCQTCGAAKFV